MHTLLTNIVTIGAVLATTLPLTAGTQIDSTVDESLKAPLVNPTGDPKLPNVLLLGDSISIGYTIPVRQYLLGKANVHRAPENCCHTAYALERTVGSSSPRLKTWLGTNQWKVIHFNWGIWDTHGIDKKTRALIQDESKVAPDQVRCRHSLDQYRTNLTEIVAMLQSTGARLIWASTTPLMLRKGARFDDISKYNAVAAEVMKQHGIPINDLYTFTLSEAKTWQHGDGCHFLPLGNEQMGKKVGELILDALNRN